jgi:hypothetical protein
MEITNQPDAPKRKIPGNLHHKTMSSGFFATQGDYRHNKWKTDSVDQGAKYLVTSKNGTN